MSFGFGVGDFLGAAELAWNLYKYCYKVARDAPEDFKLLLGEITMLTQSIRLLEEEAANPESTMRRAGDDRVRMVKEMMVRVKITLGELKKHAEKYDQLGDLQKRRNIWAKFKWSTDASDLDSLRNKLVYHNGVISLLLNSFGNSSLQRLESSHLKLERRFSEIGAKIEKFGKDTAQINPTVSIAGSGVSGMGFISATFMMNAEIGQRRWASIGVDEWIQAGRWWLMKAQMELSARSPADTAVTQQAYINLIKSSWILVDLIARHPQLNLLDSGVRYDVEVFANAIDGELGNVEKLGISKPDPAELRTYDLDIWVSQAKGPMLKPDLAKDSTNHPWVSPDEELLFQRFGVFQSHAHATAAPCIILLLLHKTENKARLVLGNQNWTIQEQFLVGKATATPTTNCVQIRETKIELSTDLDAIHLSTLWEALDEYLFQFKRNPHNLVFLQSLTLLVSLKNNHRALCEKLLDDGPDINSQADLSGRLWGAACELAPKVWRRREFPGLDISSNNADIRVPAWAIREWHKTINILLLERDGIIVGENELKPWLSFEDSWRARHQEAMDFHISRGLNDIVLFERGKSLLDEAFKNGDAVLLNRLFKAGFPCDHTQMLYQAVQSGLDAVIDTLIQAGADVTSNYRLLDDAVELGNEAVIDRLLKAGTPIGIWDFDKAVERGDEAIVDRFLQGGADVTKHDYLVTAVRKGNEAIIYKLLKAGCNPDLTHALEWAIILRNRSIVEILLQAGANVNAINFLASAARAGDEMIFDKLMEAGADIHACNLVLKAVEGRNDEILNKLLQAGAHPNKVDSEHSLLCAVMDRNDKALVVKLVNAGARFPHTTDHDQLYTIRRSAEDWDLTTLDWALERCVENQTKGDK